MQNILFQINRNLKVELIACFILNFLFFKMLPNFKRLLERNARIIFSEKLHKKEKWSLCSIFTYIEHLLNSSMEWNTYRINTIIHSSIYIMSPGFKFSPYDIRLNIEQKHRNVIQEKLREQFCICVSHELKEI